MKKKYFNLKGFYLKLAIFGVFCFLVAFTPKKAENPKKKKSVAFATKTIDPASYLPLTITGYNADVIANGLGALNTTTTNDVDGVNYCYLALGTQVSGTATPTTYGLPTSGLLDVANSDLYFQMASYSGNNSLRINQVGAAGQSTITFAEANSYEKIHLAVTSGSGASDVTFTVNFSDASTQVISNAAIPDWFSATTLPVVISGIGRGNLTNNNLENPANNPRIYQLDLNIDVANQGKIVTGITVLKNSGGVFNLFAATGKLNGTCAGPTNISSTVINSFDASVTWDSANSTDTFEVAIVNSGDAIPATGTPSATNSFNFSTLNSQTSYDVYVRTVCSPSGFSFWTGPFTFKTLCADVTEFIENFDTYAAGANTPMPDCWSKAGTASTYITTGAIAPMSSANRLYMFASGTATPPTEGYAILPAVSNLQANTHRLKFKAYTTLADHIIEVGYMSDPTDISTYIQLQEITLPSTVIANTQEFTIVPTGIPAGVKNLVIKNPGYPGSTTTAYIDDVKWEAIPACPEPTSLSVGAISATSAELIWTEGGSATTWNIEYGPTGFVQGAGTQVLGVTTNPYTITTLSPSTAYSYYVQASCGGTSGNSVWIGPFSFTTPCVAYTIPYFEGFESGYTHNTKVVGCLLQESVTGTQDWTANNTLTTYNRAPRTGAWNAFLRYGNEDWIFIPIELVGGTNYTVELYARQDGATATNSNMLISYGNNGTAAAMTNAIVPSTGIVNGNYQQLIGSFTPATSGTYYVGIKGYMNGSPWYISLDDISIDVTPTCPAPNSLAVANVTSNSADLSWMGSSANYEYVLDNNAADPTGAGTATALTTYPATTLTPLTTYYFHVRSDCGSTWSTISFTTLAAPPINDDCSGAIVLTVNPDYSCGTVSAGTVVGATDSGLTNSTCFGTEDDDVWYSFVATSTTHRVSILNITGSVTDMYHVIYDGTSGCGSLGASILCSDANTSNPNNLVVGNTYYVQVYTYTSTGGQNTTFDVCVGTPPTCYVPTALSAVYVAPTSANISWTAPTLGNPPAGYNWEIVPQGNAQGVGVVSSGNTATTSAIATGLTASTLYDLYVQTDCGGTDQSSWVMTSFITDYCLPTGTSASSYIDSFSTSLGATNITNNASGFSASNYGNFTTMSTSLGATQSFDFNVVIVGGTVGCAIWIDWGNDFSFDISDMVYSTTSYGNGPFTGSITIPSGTPNGNYRMRVMIDFNDSNPGNDDACGYSSGRGESEDYIVTVDNALASINFDNSSFIAYPNPVNDVLNLSYSSEISSVKVINLLGQEVISRKVGNTATQIDMTNLTAGAYIVNITVGDVTKAIKVIKQ